MTKLYHSEIRLPNFLKNQVAGQTILLEYSRHARRAATDDRYGYINLPDSIRVKVEEIFEVEATNGKVTKFAARTSYDETRDLILVVRGNVVVTVWINLKSDTHKTLNKTKYEK
jgi:hypothetical protein